MQVPQARMMKAMMRKERRCAIEVVVAKVEKASMKAWRTFERKNIHHKRAMHTVDMAVEQVFGSPNIL
jgi:hypothetical protein